MLTPPVLNQIETETLPAKNPSINRVLNHLQLQMKSTKRRSLQQEYKHAISVLSKNLQPIAEEGIDSRAEKQPECQKAPAAVVTPVKNKMKAASVNAKNEDKLKAKIEVLQREIKNIQLCRKLIYYFFKLIHYFNNTCFDFSTGFACLLVLVLKSFYVIL